MDQDTALLLTREQDMKTRMNGGQKLIEYLSTTEDDISLWSNIDKIVDSLSTYWVSSSNFKVALLGLDILSLLVEQLERDFQQYYNLVQNCLVDRLGDQKDQVRDASVTLLTNIMDVASTPQYLFEKLAPAFTHKVWRVREGVCRLLVATINRFGAKSLYLSRLLPHVCKLLSDPHSQVRDSATLTIVEIYRHVGEKVRQDLAKKNLPPNRLQALNERFDECQQAGDMVPVSDTASLASSTGSYDSVDSMSSAGLMRSPLTAIATNNSNSRSYTATSSSYASTDGPARSISAPARKSTAASAPRMSRSNAGALDEDLFARDFESKLPTVRLSGARDVTEQLAKINSILSDDHRDWEERTKALKALRAIIFAGGTEYDAFYQYLREMEPALQLNAKDLRSQVVRETCVTVGYLSTTLKNQFDHCAEALLPTLFSLIPNSAKVMSTSGILSIRTILQHTHSHRFILTVLSNCASKSNSIRQYALSFLGIIFDHWSTGLLERHLAALKESVYKGINDANSEVREEARKAWAGLQKHFPAEAEQVFSDLNPSQQKLIKGGLTVTDSIPSFSKPLGVAKKSRVQTTTTGPAARRVVHRAPPSAGLRPVGNGGFLRSRSDIDPKAAQRSKIKANMRTTTMGRVGRTTNSHHTNNISSKSSMDRGRQSDRPAISQRSLSATRFAGSRSNSPGSQRKTYGLSQTPNRNTKSRIASYSSNRDQSPNRDFDAGLYRSGLNSTRTPPSSPTQQRKSRIPVSNSRHGSRAGSRVGSRAGSPTGSRGASRSSSPHRYRGRSTSNISSQAHPPLRVLPKGREGEMALNDALRKHRGRGAGDSYSTSDNDDDMSDTSSVCSDRSYSSSSRNGLKRHPPHTEDIAEILQLCQSGLWTERKEGLVSLHALINKQRDFSRMQLKKILEIFNRMFADPNGKVFSMFLEMLPDFVACYKDSIHDWLYVLLTQLLKKMGADLLGSVQAKVMKALQVTRESFPSSLQFNILSRYIVDQTQKPSLKVRLALLHYMLELTGLMEMKEIVNNSDTRLAVSRIITWTTEPKSHDVRKVAEALLLALFDLNAQAFTMMIRVLPKTFQDGAMKVLHQYMKLNGETNASQSDSSGHVISRIGVSPGRKVLSPRGSVGTLEIRSPRTSIDAENMNREEIAENFRDITAGIQKLRMDSSADLDSYSTPKETVRSPTRTGVVNPSAFSPLQQLQNSPQLPSSKSNKYNPTVYSDVTNSPQLISDIVFDMEDGFVDDISLSEPDSLIAEVARELSGGANKRRALEDLSRSLRASDAKEGIEASQQIRQWDQHFNSILTSLLEMLRAGDAELRIHALTVLREMLRYLSNRFKSCAEMTIIHILEAHRDSTKEVVKAAEEAGNALCSVVPPLLCVKVLTPLTTSVSTEGTQACLKMLTNSVNRCSPDELTSQIVADLVPGVLKCYDNTESGIRKAAVFCLVAIHRVIGEAELSRHLSSLSGGKMRLLQLYIKRSQGASTAADV